MDPKALNQPMPRRLDRDVVRRMRCDYLLYLPEGYGDLGTSWPLLLYLHGAGERGENLELVRKHGPLRHVAEGQQFPFIIVAPQCPANAIWDADVLSTLLDEACSTLAVDTDRVYVTGLSMGGFGTWNLALHSPYRFAAIAPICGGGYPYIAHRIRHLPVWAFHGAKDPVVPLSESQRMVDALIKAGGKPRLTVYPDAGHDAWTQTYSYPELYRWLLSHRRVERGE